MKEMNAPDEFHGWMTCRLAFRKLRRAGDVVSSPVLACAVAC